MSVNGVPNINILPMFRYQIQIAPTHETAQGLAVFQNRLDNYNGTEDELIAILENYQEILPAAKEIGEETVVMRAFDAFFDKQAVIDGVDGLNGDDLISKINKQIGERDWLRAALGELYDYGCTSYNNLYNSVYSIME